MTVAMDNPEIYELREGAFGRWIIVHPEDDTLAWTGSRWERHYEGVPAGLAQICNFESEADAHIYADRHLMRMVNAAPAR